MAITPQHRMTQHSDTSTFLPRIRFLHIFYIPLQNQTKKPKIFLFDVQIQRRKPHKKLKDETYKRPPKVKRPPTTDRAERPTLVRGSRPNLPTASAALFLLPPTSSRNYCGKSVCYGWLALHNQLHTIVVGQIGAPPQPAGT